MNDFRNDAFKAKFATAAKALGVTPDNIVSLKIRDNVNSYDEYRDLIHSLERELGFQSSPVTGELQGRGHLLTKDKSNVIVVEHESGLEILYIAGSIASLIGIIPLILQGWNVLRQFAHPKNPFNEIEVRRLDQTGKLQEHTAHLFQRHGAAEASDLALTTASLIEEEFQKLHGQIEKLLPQITAMEQRLRHVEDTLTTARPAKRTKKK